MTTATGFLSNESDCPQPRLTRAAVHVIVADVVGATLGLTPFETVSLSPDRCLDSDDLGVDSLQLLELAGRVSSLFRLPEIGNEDNLLRDRSLAGWTDTVLTAIGQPDHPGLELNTSGSTGSPIGHRHNWSWLQHEVGALSQLFDDRLTIIYMVPKHHIYGLLFTVMLPERLSVEVMDIRAASPTGVIRRLRSGDLFVSIPLGWQQMLSGLGESSLPDDVVGVTSTGPCPREVALGLKDRGLDRLIEVYGSTETGGVGWRSHPDGSFRFFPQWSFDAHGKLLRAGPAGVADGVEPPDRLIPQGEGFVVAGRHDRAVQVAGTNVYPSRVAARLVGHPAVAACAVRLMRQDEGERLKTFVVLVDGKEPSNSYEELRLWLGRTFTAAERPASITFGSSLPRSDQGKDADWIVSHWR